MSRDFLKYMNIEIRKHIEKIVVSVGIGKLTQRPQFKDKVLPEITKELSIITGQKAAIRQAKKAIANFKTRTGDPIGLQITLRGARMEDFFQKMIHLAFPRVKDFRGIVLTHIDQRGNLNIGFREQYVFPEIDIDHSTVNFGLQVTIVPKQKNREKAIDFYRSAGVPLKK
jgi:large subunit ribosomal protein L5